MSDLFDKINDFESENEKFDKMIRSSEEHLEQLMNQIKKSMRQQAKQSAKQFLDRYGL
jgi:flagellar biosynthesis/type III secretory pathway protein FliH